MTLHPTRLALLISLTGVGLSAGSQQIAPHESARAEMARVLHALGLDAAEHAAAVSANAGWRPAPSGMRLGGLEEPLSFVNPGPSGWNVSRVEALEPPPAPVPFPNAPVDPRVLAGPVVRPMDEPDDFGRLDPVAPGDDGARSRLDSDSGDTTAVRAGSSPAGEGMPVVDVRESVAESEALLRGEPPLADVAVNRADRPGPADVSPSDQVLRLLATLTGLPDAAPTQAKPTITPAMAEAEPASTDQIDKPAAISPVEHVLDDLAALRGKSETEQAPARAPWGGETVAMDASRLDGVRGGFVAHSGLKLSFGIERAVYINGTLVTTTALNVSDLGNLSAGQAAVASLNGGTLAIVQSGTGNTFLPGAVSASSIGTVIQNTLDNQHIQSVTTINATVNSGEILRSMNLQQSVQNAVTSSR